MSFIRWCGGKSQSVKIIIEKFTNCLAKDALLYEDERPINYIEPFLGSGIVLINFLKWCKNYINPKYLCFHCYDINKYLIDCFNQIKTNPIDLINELDKYVLPIEEKTFYELRNTFNNYIKEDIHNLESVGLFIVLNKTCFKGLYQTNKKGEFNTPFGKKQTLKRLYNPELLFELNDLFNYYNVEFNASSFEDIPYYEHSLYYLDPPYENTFNAYDKIKFDFNKFNDFLKDISIHGYVFLSNLSTYEPPQHSFIKWSKINLSAPESMHPKNHKLRREEVLLFNNY